MTDWTGAGTTITVTPSVGAAACLEYLTVADVRAEYGDDVVDLTDAQLQRRIDRLVASLQAKLGHTFGQALIARSTAADTVQVTATALLIGGTSFAFATYPTLYDLIAAVSAASAVFSLELLPNVRAGTPSTLLAAHGAATCGPGAERRVVLCLDALYCKLSGAHESHLFLPSPVQEVITVVENNVVLSAAAYWSVLGESWLIRKLCGCTASDDCPHPTGAWPNTYPGNIAVTYVPSWWGHVPADLQGALLDAFGAKLGGGAAGGLIAEDFGEYSYHKGATRADTWDEILGGATVRRYATKFQP